MRVSMAVAERSGDQLAALLLGGMRQAWPDLQASGIGGPQMAAQGFDASRGTLGAYLAGVAWWRP